MNEFQQDLALIVELEDELRLISDGLSEQDWVKDRIENLQFLYQHMQRCWWPIVPGRGTEHESGIEC